MERDESAGTKAGEPLLRSAAGTGRWDAVELRHYKDEAGSPFQDVTRQVLFDEDGLACQLRYFEVGPGGRTTLERHEHVHAVLILHGTGRCLVGDRVFDVSPHDLVRVPPSTWHQFRAAADGPLGFLCMVNRERDRPRLPTAAEVAQLRRDPVVDRFLGDAA
jgi:quercetin dioxygenase-like cupin family protein